MDEFIQVESPSVKYHRKPPRKPLTTKEITALCTIAFVLIAVGFLLGLLV